MVEIRPFKGVLYNQKKVSISRVIAPPYDVISPDEQNKLYNLHPANIVRLILGKEYPRDNSRYNRYSRAAGSYKKWLEERILLFDRYPSIYAYRIDFKERGKKKTRIGFIALADLRGDNNRVLPHERTFSGPKRDRLMLLRVCHANFSQIFTLYSDPRKKVSGLIEPFIKKRPYLKISYNGERHSIWKIRDRATIARIKKIMRNKDIFIADGHHRYEVAKIFSREMGRAYGYNSFVGSHYAMLYFSNMDEEGLVILPSHRLVRKGFVSQDRLKCLERYFDISTYPYNKKSFEKVACILTEHRQAFGLLAKGERELKTFILRDVSFINRFIRGNFSRSKRRLATTILDEGVLKGVLKIRDFEKAISYTRDIKSAEGEVESGGFQYAFLLAPTNLSELKEIVRCGDKMPHKSTYFYPKLLSGLVIYDQERGL